MEEIYNKAIKDKDKDENKALELLKYLSECQKDQVEEEVRNSKETANFLDVRSPQSCQLSFNNSTKNFSFQKDPKQNANLRLALFYKKKGETDKANEFLAKAQEQFTISVNDAYKKIEMSYESLVKFIETYKPEISTDEK